MKRLTINIDRGPAALTNEFVALGEVVIKKSTKPRSPTVIKNTKKILLRVFKKIRSALSNLTKKNGN